MSIKENIRSTLAALPDGVKLVAVSKTHPAEAVAEAYEAGQRIFGENRPQELAAKYEVLPKDIEWHMIGHLQTNKVKMIAPFVSMIESVDSGRLLNIINAEALKHSRTIDILLEIRIAQEQTKSGWEPAELTAMLDEGSWRRMQGVVFRGVMGIATNTDDMQRVREEFERLKGIYETLRDKYFDARFDTVSMGMSGDWPLAVECGSNMVRIGSSIFGNRNYAQ